VLEVDCFEPDQEDRNLIKGEIKDEA